MLQRWQTGESRVSSQLFYCSPLALCYLRGQYFFRLVSEALHKMNGKFVEIAGSHVAARVLQVSLSSYF